MNKKTKQILIATLALLVLFVLHTLSLSNKSGFSASRGDSFAGDHATEGATIPSRQRTNDGSAFWRTRPTR